MDLIEGAVIGQRYRLTRLVGEGGMGAVWAASHLVTRKSVALKFLKPAGASNTELVRRFLREARAASAVKHPNVVQIHDILQDEEGIPIMVMDLLEGESLAERLERERMIPLGDLARLIVPVLSAVGTAHSLGIVHRDLKPDNIFLSRLPDGRIEPKVLDFGIAKLSAHEGDAAQTSALTRTGSMLGTPYYMSPEQAFGEKDVDSRADVWSMGVILYECLSGKRPVDGDNFGQLLKVIMMGKITPFAQAAPGMPAEIHTLVDSMMCSDRAARTPSLATAFDVLKRYADIAATGFADPITVNRFDRATTAPPSLMPAAGARTPVALEGALEHTDNAFARTTYSGNARSRRVIAVAVTALAVTGLGSGFLLWKRAPRLTGAETALSASTTAAAAASQPPSPPQVTPSTSVETQPPAPLPTPASSASAAPLTPVTPGGPLAVKPRTAASKPPADRDPPPPPPKTKLPFNVPEAAPF